MRSRDHETTLITAAWVAAISDPIIKDGAVVFDAGQIAAVGPARQIRAAHPEAVVHDAGNALLLPGLINAHTHLELSNCSAGDPPASFMDWIASLPMRIGPDRDF